MKLMVPGEVARCMVQPKYAYKVSRGGRLDLYEYKASALRYVRPVERAPVLIPCGSDKEG